MFDRVRLIFRNHRNGQRHHIIIECLRADQKGMVTAPGKIIFLVEPDSSCIFGDYIQPQMFSTGFFGRTDYFA